MKAKAVDSTSVLGQQNRGIQWVADQFRRFVPGEVWRVWLLTPIVGVVCGLVGVAFQVSIRWVERQLIHRALGSTSRWWPLFVISVVMIGALVCGLLLTKVGPAVRGSGIPQVKVAYEIDGGYLSFRQVMAKFCVCILQIGSGGSLGRGGPTVYLCAGLASLAGRVGSLSRERLRRMVPVGAAAGIASAFGAPLAGVAFALEEIVGGLNMSLVAGTIVAAAVAAGVERLLLGKAPLFDVPHLLGVNDPASFAVCLLVGVSAAMLAVVFHDGLLRVRRRFRETMVIPEWVRPAVGAFVTAIVIVSARSVLQSGGINGGGRDTLNLALQSGLTWRVMAALCLGKLVATVSSYSSGGAGGILLPSLFLGGMLGGTVGQIDRLLFRHDRVGLFVLVGMGAMFAGVVRAPITSVLIVLEVTHRYEIVLPLMAANAIAYLLARYWRPMSISEALLEQDGIVQPSDAIPAAT